MIQNIVIGTPLVPVHELLAFNYQDYVENEDKYTLYTTSRFLPVVMKEAGLVSSISEVKRNQPQLMKELQKPECFWLKWGKKKVYIVVGE